MDSITQIRILIIILSVAYLAPRFYFRIQARKARIRKPDSTRQKPESRLRLTIMAISGMGANLTAILWVINPIWVEFAEIPLPAWTRWLGIGSGIVAIVLGYLSHRTLSTNFTDFLETRQGHRLVTVGVYSFIRHPIYASFYFLFGASFLVTQNALVGVLAIVYCLAIYNRAVAEEAMLLGEFGDDYRKYMQRTGRILPRIRR
jgi:protein-S-isoprenylcysteine O-methyltransferase Ste14